MPWAWAERMRFPPLNLLGLGDLLEEMCKLLPEPVLDESGEENHGPVKIAVVGRPNVGKILADKPHSQRGTRDGFRYCGHHARCH